MKILYVITSTDVGGAEKSLVSLVKTVSPPSLLEISLRRVQYFVGYHIDPFFSCSVSFNPRLTTLASLFFPFLVLLRRVLHHLQNYQNFNSVFLFFHTPKQQNLKFKDF